MGKESKFHRICLEHQHGRRFMIGLERQYGCPFIVLEHQYGRPFIVLEHQYGRPFIVLEHQYGRRDVM